MLCIPLFLRVPALDACHLTSALVRQRLFLNPATKIALAQEAPQTITRRSPLVESA